MFVIILYLYNINWQIEYKGDYAYDKKIKGERYDKNSNLIYEIFNGSRKVKEYYDKG